MAAKFKFNKPYFVDDNEKQKWSNVWQKEFPLIIDFKIKRANIYLWIIPLQKLMDCYVETTEVLLNKSRSNTQHGPGKKKYFLQKVALPLPTQILAGGFFSPQRTTDEAQSSAQPASPPFQSCPLFMDKILTARRQEKIAEEKE